MKWQCRSGPILAVIVCFAMLGSGVAYATSLGDDITIFDNMSGNVWNSGYGADTRTNPGGAPLVQEDSETEPGTQTGQQWDLEALYRDGSDMLSIAGGYNFATGAPPSGGNNYDSGDVFLAVNPASSVLPPNTTGAGFTHVVVFDRNVNDDLNVIGGQVNYTVYAISGLTVGGGLLSASAITNSNPYRLDPNAIGGIGVSFVGTGTATLTSYATDAAFHTALNAGVGEYEPVGSNATSWSPASETHYVLSGINLGLIGAVEDDAVTVHYTYECGNDVIIGAYTVPGEITVLPEPASLVVVGMGLGLMAFGAKRKQRKS